LQIHFFSLHDQWLRNVRHDLSGINFDLQSTIPYCSVCCLLHVCSEYLNVLKRSSFLLFGSKLLHFFVVLAFTLQHITYGILHEGYLSA
jgi:hypothetical protein